MILADMPHADQVAALQGSFSQVYEQAEIGEECFYKRLGQTAPDLARLHRQSRRRQGLQLTDMVSLIVAAISNVGAVMPIVRDIAKQHAEMGIRQEDYPVIGSVLITMLQERLGPHRFNLFVRQSWEAAFDAVARAMIDAAYPARSAAIN